MRSGVRYWPACARKSPEMTREQALRSVQLLIGRGDLGTLASLPWEAVVELIVGGDAFAEALQLTPGKRAAPAALDRRQALLARMAGNIAAGMMVRDWPGGIASPITHKAIAGTAVGIARAIVRELVDNPDP